MAENPGNNSSNGKGWRQRIGVKGSMPKISDEFRSEPKQAPQPTSPPVVPNQSANPRPVARPAPMAPRRPAPRPAPASRPAAPAPAVATKRESDFSSRLKAQREAAEANAKRRSDETRARLAGQNVAAGNPKFSFADEELQEAKSERTPPPPPEAARAAPPRTPAAPAPAANEAGTSQPQTRAPRPPFRPMHQAGSPKPYQPSDAYRQTHGYREYDNPSQPEAPQHVAPGRPSQSRYEDQSYTPPAQNGYTPPQSRNAPYRDDLGDDLFDDRAAPPSAPRGRRRAAADDYSAAYRDYDDAFDYEEEKPRRGGMWLFLVLMLLVVGAIAAGAYWYINFSGQIGPKSPTSNTGVPTIPAPENPVKVAPAPSESASPNAPVKRKKIYDRILGDQTLEPEKLVPTEEQPKTQPPAIQPPPEVKTPSQTAPVGVQPLPLPLPPPPTVPGTQGSLSGKSGKLALNGAKQDSVPTSGSTAITPTSGGTGKTTTNGGQTAPLTLPAAPSQNNPLVPSQPSTETASTPAPTSSPVAAPDVTEKAVPVPRKKPNSIKAIARQAAEQRRLAALSRSVSPAPTNPVIPPPQNLSGAGPAPITPGTTRSQNFSSGTTTAPVAPPSQAKPQTNVASLPQPTTPAPQTGNGQGYVLQMSVFRSRSGADAEYRRLVSRHGSLLSGLQPQIQESDLGANGKFYKLRLGSVSSRNKAARICNSLIAAGEKDCLVRTR